MRERHAAVSALQLEETDLFRTPLSPCISPTDPLGWLERLCRSSPLSGKTGLIAVIFRGVGELTSIRGRLNRDIG
jgi:hypothetical protein